MNDFKKYKFSDLYDFTSGISSSPSQAGHGFPFVYFSTVFNNYFLPNELDELMNTSKKEQDTYSVLKGDILLTRTSETIDELGMSCVAIKDYPNATYSGFTKRLRPLQNDITYDKFMAFYLRSELFRKTMENNAVLTLRASLNEDIFSYLDLLLPKYSEQEKIGDLLYSINSKIEINNQINKELELMQKTLYEYWFVQFDFPDKNGKPYKSSGGNMIYNNKLRRVIPESWNPIKLNQIFKADAGYPFESTDFLNDGKYKIITIKNVQFNNLNTIKVDHINQLPSKIAGTSILNIGDVLMSLTGNVGRICFVNEDNLLLNQRVGKIYSENIDTSFIYILMQSEYVYKSAIKLATGSNQKNLSPVELLNIDIAYDIDTISRFVKIINPTYQQLINNQRENIELSKLRDWLLPMLINGQVSVK